MWFVFFSWFWHICVAVVVGVSGSFVLEYLFVIPCQVVLMGRWLWFCHFACVLSQEIIHHLVFLPTIDVHIGHWGQLFLDNFSARGFSPVCLHCFHVPLVDHCHNAVFFYVVNVSENSLTSPVHQNIFLFWSDPVEHSYQKVDSASVTWFGKGLASSGVKSVHPIFVVVSPCGLNFKEIP